MKLLAVKKHLAKMLINWTEKHVGFDFYFIKKNW